MQFSALLLTLLVVAALTCIIKDYNTNDVVSVQGQGGDNMKYIEGTMGKGRPKLFDTNEGINACMGENVHGFKYIGKKATKITFKNQGVVDKFNIHM